MQRLRVLGILLALMALARATPASAHPVPFSYLDIRLEGQALELTLVAHLFDVGHDVNVTRPEELLSEEVLRSRGPQFAALLADRLQLVADGRPLAIGAWSAAEALPDRQSIRLRARAELAGTPGVIRVTARLFPYDPVHQTFVNFYERDQVTAQAILDVGRTAFTYYAGTPRGIWAVVRSLLTSGIVHIVSGPEHLLILLGLLLVSSTRRQVVLIASAFTLGHVVTLSLAALNILNPPARLVEPAIALSIVYVGVDNLMVHGGRDIRPWISLVFGAIHGLGFAAVLQAMELPRPALVWSIVSFNLGVQIGQVLAALAVALVLATLRSRSETLGSRLAFAGSLVVIAAGTVWFVQRVFFPGAMA